MNHKSTLVRLLFLAAFLLFACQLSGTATPTATPAAVPGTTPVPTTEPNTFSSAERGVGQDLPHVAVRRPRSWPRARLTRGNVARCAHGRS